MHLQARIVAKGKRHMNRRRFLAASAATLFAGRALAARPKAQGLAVPGMAAGSPGMEGPRTDPYEVLLFQRDGSYVTYAKYAR